jgi:hypothetical protein
MARGIAAPRSSWHGRSYGGAAEKAGSGSGEAGRVRPERAESSIQAGLRILRPDRRQERRLEAYRTPNVPERSGRGERKRTLRDAGLWRLLRVRLKRTAGTPKGSKN